MSVECRLDMIHINYEESKEEGEDEQEMSEKKRGGWKDG